MLQAATVHAQQKHFKTTLWIERPRRSIPSVGKSIHQSDCSSALPVTRPYWRSSVSYRIQNWWTSRSPFQKTNKPNSRPSVMPPSPTTPTGSSQGEARLGSPHPHCPLLVSQILVHRPLPPLFILQSVSPPHLPNFLTQAQGQIQHHNPEPLHLPA